MPDTTKAQEQGTDEATVAAVRPAPPWPIIIVGIVITVVLMFGFMWAWTLLSSDHESGSLNQFGALRQNGSSNSGLGNGRYGGRSGFFGDNGGSGGGSLSQSAAADGVITAVNGQTLTVAGQGKSVTVNESDSTTIGGDKSDVAVNDTVIVYGTTNSDGSIDASRILVRNQTSMGGMSNDNSDVPPGA